MSNSLYRWIWFFIVMILIYTVSGRGWFDDLHPVTLALTALGSTTLTAVTILGSEYLLKKAGLVHESSKVEEGERDVR